MHLATCFGEDVRARRPRGRFPLAGSSNVARKKTPKVRLSVKASVSRRLREIREEIFGEHGGPELARRLNLPARTWYNYETGVTVPAEVLLEFIEQTGANPIWLLNGQGPRYHHSSDDSLLSQLTPVELIRRGLEGLERTSQAMTVVAPQNMPDCVASEFVAIGVYPLSELAGNDAGQHVGRGTCAGLPAMAAQSQADDRDSVDRRRHASHPACRLDCRGRPTVTDPHQLHGKIVAARPDGVPMIRWLEVSGRHLILRPNNQISKEFPLIPVEFDDQTSRARRWPGGLVLEPILPDLNRQAKRIAVAATTGLGWTVLGQIPWLFNRADLGSVDRRPG